VSNLEQGAITGGVAYRRKQGVMDKEALEKLYKTAQLGNVANVAVTIYPNQLLWLLESLEAAEARAAELQAEVERLRAELEECQNELRQY